MTAKDKNNVAANPSYETDWTAEEELHLFYAMDNMRLRPLGINRHFYMAAIAERISRSLNRDVHSDIIWRHLHSMYKLENLDEMEALPFPNEEREFSLPEAEYATFLQKKRDEIIVEDDNQVSGNSQQPPQRPQSTDSTGPPSIIAVATDSNGKILDKLNTTSSTTSTTTKVTNSSQGKDLEKKLTPKLLEIPKRPPKRTRGSMSVESNSPSTTPPPMQNTKRRRI